MPNGKPAGERCIQLDADNLCKLFGNPTRPTVCERFRFDIDVCGKHREEALTTLTWLESSTG